MRIQRPNRDSSLSSIPACFWSAVVMMILATPCVQALSRTILITGATDGIGRHTAQKLAQDGHTLLVHGRRPGRELVADLNQRGAANVQYFNADLADLTQVETLAQEICQSAGHLDVLINNAGVFDPPDTTSAQGFDTTWAVNVMAPFLLTRRLLPLVAQSQDDCPRIITTSSISQSSLLPSPVNQVFQPNPSAHSAYSHSKLGDRLFTQHLATLLKEHPNPQYNKITCLTMDPGTVNTKMLLAGWGACGISVKKADNTYQLATAFGAQQESGTYHFGWGGGSRESNANIREMWSLLEQHTGCTYSDI